MANSYLVRTPSSAGNRKTFTISVWVKRSKLSYDYAYMVTAGEYNQDQMAQFKFDSNDQFNISGYASNGSKDFRVHTNRRFRDTSAWYHVMAAVDTTQSTAADRVKVYVNGVQETSFSEATYPSQNYDTAFNLNGIQSNIGVRAGTGVFFEGYLSHVAIVDGAALTPTSFGETDSTSGIWKFKSPTGVTWGTNGVHLKFESSGNLGLDSSGQTNNYTVNGNLKQALDTPSNVYATYNTNISQTANVAGRNASVGISLINGNLSNGATAAIFVNQLSTLGFSKGKFYAEFLTTGDTYAAVGIVNQKYSDASLGAYIGSDTTSGVNNIGYQSVTGAVKKNNSTSYTGATYTSANDIIGVAVDMDNNYIYFSKNGTWQNSGDPTSGSTGTGGVAITQDTYFFASDAHNNTGSGTQYIHANFGNGFFGTTAITSAGSNGNGSLFEYDVPTGYYALNTKNINTYG